jgi:hypothetical protein
MGSFPSLWRWAVVAGAVSLTAIEHSGQSTSEGRRMMTIASDLKTKVEVDFDSDDIGEVEAPGREKQPLVVAAKQSTLP